MSNLFHQELINFILCCFKDIFQKSVPIIEHSYKAVILFPLKPPKQCDGAKNGKFIKLHILQTEHVLNSLVVNWIMNCILGKLSTSENWILANLLAFSKASAIKKILGTLHGTH